MITEADFNNPKFERYYFISCNRREFKCIEDCIRPVYNLKQLYNIYRKDKKYQHKRDNNVNKKYILIKYFNYETSY